MKLVSILHVNTMRDTLKKNVDTYTLRTNRHSLTLAH